jgi:hypothetical protein
VTADLRLVDDEDDSLAANQDDPRGDLGYETTTEPRLRRRQPGGPTRWEFVEVPARPGDVGGPNVCRDRASGGCGEPSATLHADPRTSAPQRVLCPRCTGDRMRDLMESQRGRR